MHTTPRPLPAMPSPRRVSVGEIDLCVYEAGPLDSAAPPIVLCHGFPEIAYSWRAQIRDLAAAGYRVIAPDLRGYGQSDRPIPVEAYDMPHLCADLSGLLDALGIDKAIFCGHDWGGLIVWQMPLLHPARVAGIIGVNTPFLPRPPIDPIQLFRALYGEDMYIVFFQTPEAPEALFSADLAKTFRFFMRRTGTTIEQFEALPAERRSLALQKALPAFESEADAFAPFAAGSFLNESELQIYVEAYRDSGFAGPVNYYRNMSRNWTLSADWPQRIEQPALMIMADRDVVLQPRMADGMEAFVPDLAKALIRDCGHWTQQERPVETSAAIIAWLRARF